MAHAIVCDQCGAVQGIDAVLEWYQVKRDGERWDFCRVLCLLAFEALAAWRATWPAAPPPGAAPAQYVRVGVESTDGFRYEAEVGERPPVDPLEIVW